MPRFSKKNPLDHHERAWMTYDNIDANANTQARALLKFIQSQFGWHYLSGQQDINSFKWVQSQIGKAPAILGNDFINYSPAAVQNGAIGQDVDIAISNDKAGGINTFCWHWIAPANLGKDGQPWYSGFYTKATSFNLKNALAEGPGGTIYKLLLRDIDAIAAQIKKLQDNGVPILFRPLHEPDGAWFWWGATGSGPFKELWNLIYSRLTNYHGLHNMVWVCNTEKSDWYPGNDKCDIVTTDIYATASDRSPQASAWQTLYGLSGGNRVLALAEVGVIPDPQQQLGQNIPWAYWVTWAGDFISGGSFNSKQFLYNVYSDSNVATVDGVTKIGNWKSTT
ncbi:mannan endo-1,4-beta-mannosidase [Paraphaeosphaeria sporulosa]